MWVLDYRVDGLRFDAVHAITEKDFLVEMAGRLRAAAGKGRHLHLVLENGTTTSTCWKRATTPSGTTTAITCCMPCSPANARATTPTSPRRPPASWRAASARLRLPGRVHPARPPARAIQRAPAADRLRTVPAEPRPGRQPCLRRASGQPGRAGRTQGRHRPAVAQPDDPAAVHGRGMGLAPTLPVLHLTQRGAGPRGARRAAQRVPRIRGVRRRADPPQHSRPQRPWAPSPAPSPTAPPAPSPASKPGASTTGACWSCATRNWCHACPAARPSAPGCWRKRPYRPAGAWVTAACCASTSTSPPPRYVRRCRTTARGDLLQPHGPGRLPPGPAGAAQRRRDPGGQRMSDALLADLAGAAGLSIHWTDADGRPQQVAPRPSARCSKLWATRAERAADPRQPRPHRPAAKQRRLAPADAGPGASRCRWPGISPPARPSSCSSKTAPGSTPGSTTKAACPPSPPAATSAC